MRDVEFSYSMRLTFDVPITKHRFTIKCIPCTNDRQTINSLSIDVNPNGFLSKNCDSFGNLYLYGLSMEEHNCFSIELKGRATLGKAKKQRADDTLHMGIFKYQTPITNAGEEIKAFVDGIVIDEGMSVTQQATIYMHKVYEHFLYVPGATNVNTTANEAFVMGKGVCQDYSHVLLSMCRYKNIPCRYVVGLLMGEGASHAWVEVYDNGYWVELDPTNDLVVDDSHIKLSCGRDYSDCLINHGVFNGYTNQTQEVLVSVKDMVI